MSNIEPAAVEDLLDAAFGTDRFGRTAYRIRKGMDAVPALSFAAIEDGALVGTIQCWPVAHRTADGTATPLDPERLRRVHPQGPGGSIVTNVMPLNLMEEWLRSAPGVVLTDDFAPADNLVAPLFAERGL